jgi:hypothetical protein
VPHVTPLLAWTHQKDDAPLKLNIISTLMRQSYPQVRYLRVYSYVII